MIKILITGATGFLGNHLINELLKNNKVEIIATSRSIEKAKTKPWFSKVRYIHYDLNNLENLNLYEYFDKPDKLIHLAWEGLPNYNDIIHIEKNLFNSYRFIKNLILNDLKDITVIGTCLEYGMENGSLEESLQTNPSNSYAIAKDSLRKFLEELHKNFYFRNKWVRLFYMYGEGQSDQSLLSQLHKAIEKGDREFNMSKGEQLRDYLSIKDVVSKIILLSLHNESIGIVNCCSGTPISIRNLVEQYIEKKKVSIRLNLGYYQYPDYEAMAFWGNDSKFKRIVGE